MCSKCRLVCTVNIEKTPIVVHIHEYIINDLCGEWCAHKMNETDRNGMG